LPRKILVINGHPDPSQSRFAAALANAYLAGAAAAGHETRRLDVGGLDFPLIRTAAAFESDEPPPPIRDAQQSIVWADHVVIVFPLWLGGAPALLKGFFEQVFRYGFALSGPGQPMRRLLRGRSARVIVTMGMPAPVFRLAFGAFGARALERGLLWISGFGPIRRTVIGAVEGSAVARRAWLRRIRQMGAAGR
jgi:putative NADPH-quinone reductase